MRTAALHILILASIALTAAAQIIPLPDAYLPFDYATNQIHHPFRRVHDSNGDPIIVDLRPLFAWIRAGGGAARWNTRQPMPAWAGLRGYEILYQSKEHILIQHIEYKDFGDQRTTDRSEQILVFKNYPFETRDGATISVVALKTGLTTIHDRFGIPHKHQTYDYGVPLTDLEAREYLATNKPPVTRQGQVMAPTRAPTNAPPKIKVTLSEK